MVEDILLSRGGLIILSKVLSFMKSLHIKLNNEANKFETKEIVDSYLAYKNAKYEMDSFLSYTFDEHSMSNYQSLLSLKNNKFKLNDMLNYNPDANNLLQELRDNRINTYVERNKYYASFNGKPVTTSDIVRITVEPDDNSNISEIPIHTLTDYNYPLTYNRIFIKNNIKHIIDENPDLDYLLHIKQPVDIIYAREAGNFSIIKYDSTLMEETEINYFLKVYNESREYIMQVPYVEDFSSRYENYESLMLCILLYVSFSRFCNYMLKRYSIRDYTDGEIYNILDSYNLSNLKDLDINILKKVVENIGTLIKLKGSTDIFPILLELCNISSSSIKRYSLRKSYLTLNGCTHLDNDKFIDDIIDLEFVDNVIHRSTNNKDAFSNTSIDYKTMTYNDKLWGTPLGNITDKETNEFYKRKFKEKLIREKFSTIPTKYITINQTINNSEINSNTNTIIGNILQVNKTDPFLLNDKIQFKEYIITPMVALAYSVWATQQNNTNLEPNTIYSNLYSINNVIPYRNILEKNIVVNEILNTPINTLFNNSSLLKIKDFISREEVSKHIIYFDTDNNEPFYEIINNKKDDNDQILNTIKYKMQSSTSYTEYFIWKTIYFYNKVNITVPQLVEGFTTYDSYFSNKNLQLYVYISELLKNNLVSFNNIINDITSLFYDYIYNKTKKTYFLQKETDLNTQHRLEDLKKLANEFSSLYSTIHNIEQVINITNSPFNKPYMFFIIKKYNSKEYRHKYINIMFNYGIKYLNPFYYDLTNLIRYYPIKEYNITNPKRIPIRNNLIQSNSSYSQYLYINNIYTNTMPDINTFQKEDSFINLHFVNNLILNT